MEYIPITLFLIAASTIVNVIDNEWGWNSYALWAAIAAIIAIAGLLAPSRPYSGTR